MIASSAGGIQRVVVHRDGVCIMCTDIEITSKDRSELLGMCRPTIASSVSCAVDEVGPLPIEPGSGLADLRNGWGMDGRQHNFGLTMLIGRKNNVHGTG